MTSISTPRAVLSSTGFGRGLEGFRSRPAVELQPSGITELDVVLGGGLPRGSLVELCGLGSSGRTSLAMSLLAQATDRQEACAFVDVSDSLDPASLAAAGVDLARLLWVRCGDAQKSGSLPVAEAPSLFIPSEDSISSQTGKKPCMGPYWRHPRDQIRGIEGAIPSLLQNMPALAPKEPAKIHIVARCAGEQVERDREPPRRGIHARRPATPAVEKPSAHAACTRNFSSAKPWKRPWKRLEQALKSTDLLLHSGGWGLVVFDLGGISWVDARRINMSMWFRFRQAVENTPTILLLVGEESCARSCASLVLRCRRKDEHWRRAAAHAAFGASTFDGFDVEGEIIRSRAQSQPGDFARWKTQR